MLLRPPSRPLAHPAPCGFRIGRSASAADQPGGVRSCQPHGFYRNAGGVAARPILGTRRTPSEGLSHAKADRDARRCHPGGGDACHRRYRNAFSAQQHGVGHAANGRDHPAKRDRAILSTLLFHALRREELCKLKVKDFQHARKGVPHIRVSGKGGKTRYLPLHPAHTRSFTTG